jgi:hypothetical protein
MATKTSDGVFVCVMPFSTTGPDGAPATFAEGARLEGSHEMVQRFPEYWVHEDNPTEMINRKHRLMAAAHAAATPSSANRTGAARILNTKYRAKRAVKVDVDGEARKIKKGDLLEPNDPIALIAPASFERVQVPMKGY